MAAGTATIVSASPPPASAQTPPTPVSHPASDVRPFDGTGVGAVSPGAISEFPGAVLPFGMIQWSPDTAPHRVAGSGYDHADHRISGFSLTHLSGTGCAAYGDVPILPTVGPIGSRPVATTESFSHGSERAAPGRYEVTLGPSITTRLTVTTRTGLAHFTFPPTSSANVLFKVASSASGIFGSAVQVVGPDEVEGQVTSGQFCGTGTDYTLHFVARFDRPFTTAGTWTGQGPAPASTSCHGTSCGAYVTFDAEQQRSVTMKVGISFVSTADAAANLAAEDPAWSLTTVERRATARWNAVLGRIRVGGGTASQRHVFYTALYHSLLDPNVVSDVGGQYVGEDGQVHVATDGAQYADFSEWDVYRSEIQLISVLDPGVASQMVQSLVNDADQDGWLPKWAIVAGDASQMSGDSADPIIADAAAFGARDFDTTAALQYMVKGATQNEPNQALEIERQYLGQYLAQHYVDAPSLDLDSIDYSIGGSVTLEYAIDDFAIAQLAASTGDTALADTMMGRAQNWEYEFNPATGWIQARNADGSFPPGPAFTRALFEPGGERGFEEGNAIQYTWSVPQDLAALAALMGGDHDAVTKLDTYFTKLNAGRFAPYDWAGNEPSLGIPWEYDAVGAPWRAQQVVRKILTTQYHEAPVDEPGNDDLGAMSSWAVWAAIGLYPITPGTATLALASPLFPTVVVTLPGGKRLVLHAPGASAGSPYIHRLTVTHPGTPQPVTGCTGVVTSVRRSGVWTDPWLPPAVLTTGATLTYTLSSTPDRSWGSAPTAALPSYTAGALAAVGFTAPSGAVQVHTGEPYTVRLGIQALAPGTTVSWRASTTGPLAVSSSAGRLPAPSVAAKPAGGAGCSSPAPVSESLTVTGSAPGRSTLTVAMRTATGQALPPVVLDVTDVP
jgi:predicted alpha-1,2-mannosidase